MLGQVPNRVSCVLISVKVDANGGTRVHEQLDCFDSVKSTSGYPFFDLARSTSLTGLGY